MQIITMTLNSRSVEKVATAACLCEAQDFSEDFRNLKLQYGELEKKVDVEDDEESAIGEELPLPMTVGFGTLDEVTPLLDERTRRMLSVIDAA